MKIRAIRRIVSVGVGDDVEGAAVLVKMFPEEEKMIEKLSVGEEGRIVSGEVEYLVQYHRVKTFGELQAVREHVHKYHVMLVCYVGEDPREGMLESQEVPVRVDRGAVYSLKDMRSIVGLVEAQDSICFAKKVSTPPTSSQRASTVQKGFSVMFMVLVAAHMGLSYALNYTNDRL